MRIFCNGSFPSAFCEYYNKDRQSISKSNKNTSMSSADFYGHLLCKNYLYQMLVIINGCVFNYGTSGRKTHVHPFFVISVMTTRSENCHFQIMAEIFIFYIT
jgi:hypothetical protein